jgi:biopolymer transport protein ExbD
MRTRRAYMPAHSYAPNLAPMVDVVMVILVFFMLGTSLAVSEGVLPTELPSQVGPGGAANVTIIPVVRITLLETADEKGCQIIVMGRALADNSFPALERLLQDKIEAGADPKGRVLIGASPGVEYQNVISTMDACVQAGFGNIQFSVNPNVATVVE